LKAPQAVKTKLSFKEKHALSALPAEIAKLEAELEALAVKLSDNGLYERDRTAFDVASARVSDAQRQLEQAETQWLELEEKRALIEDSGR
jgi:ABC transport system ATP-binding/permease protein